MNKEKTYEELFEELTLLSKNCKVPIITASQIASQNTGGPIVLIDNIKEGNIKVKVLKHR